MNVPITLTGNVPIPDPPPPVDLGPINTKLTDIETKIAGLETKITQLTTRVQTLESTPTTPPPTIDGRIYSATSVWYKKLDPAATISPKSASYIGRLTYWLRNTNAWINGDNYGCPLYVVTTADQKLPIYDTAHPNAPNALEIAQGINLPAKLAAAGGTDGHVGIYNKSTDTDYSFWQLRLRNGRWECSSVGILKNASQSDGTLEKFSYWNSARASNLPLGGGLITKKGLELGSLDTALVFATPKAAKTSWVYPAKSTDAESTANTDYDANALPMGLRLRFPANITINSAWTPLTKMLVVAVRDYGMILGDTTAGNSNAFYAEDCRQYGNTNIVYGYLAGKNLWDVVGNKAADGEFPWSKLVVVA